MFSCVVHNWNSHSAPCPMCFPATYTSASGSEDFIISADQNKEWKKECADLELGIAYWKGKYETACILLERNKPEGEQIKEYIEATERADKLYESHVVIPLQQKVLELEEVIYQLQSSLKEKEKEIERLKGQLAFQEEQLIKASHNQK